MHRQKTKFFITEEGEIEPIDHPYDYSLEIIVQLYKEIESNGLKYMDFHELMGAEFKAVNSKSSKKGKTITVTAFPRQYKKLQFRMLSSE